MTFIVACGLKKEARLIARPGRDLFAIAGGGVSQKLERELEKLARIFPGVIVSSGIAGALDPALPSGAIIIDGDPAFVARLSAAIPDAIVGEVIGTESIIPTRSAKAALHRTTGASAVDMETHVARRVAQRLRLPFGVIRIISDGAGDTLPPAALVGMRPDGGLALAAVLGSLGRNPRQLRALIRTGQQAGRAFRSLGRLYDSLGRAGILGLDLREFALDVR